MQYLRSLTPTDLPCIEILRLQLRNQTPIYLVGPSAPRGVILSCPSVVHYNLQTKDMRLSWSIFIRQRHYAGFVQSFWRYMRALTYTLNIHTLVMLTLSLISVYICLKIDLR